MVKHGDKLRGKTVLCNCDDPFESAFFRYFALHFNKIGLAKLISISYAGSPMAGKEYPLEEDTSAYEAVVTEVPDEPLVRQIGRAHVCTPVTNAHLVCRLLLANKKKKQI